MEYQVQLQFFQDDDTGEYGLAHKNSIDRGFNAFFNAIGLFHDIMEHYFEDIHPNFSGKYAFNYGGEIAASGHSLWYIHGLGLSRRWSDLGNYNGIEEAFTRTVGLENELAFGWTRFGDELLCKCRNIYEPHPNYSQVPYYHWDYWQGFMKEYPRLPKDDEGEVARKLRKSLSLNKLHALYGWGYYTAKKIVPNTNKNIETIERMYDDLHRFCQFNNARELASMFKYFTAYITPGKRFNYRFTVSDGLNEFDATDSSQWFEED